MFIPVYPLPRDDLSLLQFFSGFVYAVLLEKRRTFLGCHVCLALGFA